MSGPMSAPEGGVDASVILSDERVVEYWDGGDPAGRPVLFHPGTPVTRLLGRWAHQAASEAGIRLIAVNRPGYGGSTTLREPSLRAVGRDTAELARRLGLDEFAVVGSSGGGPFAMATAVEAPDAVRALGIAGAIGPWRELVGASEMAEDREILARLDAGDVDGAWAGFHEQLARDRGGLSPKEEADVIVPPDGGAVARDPAYRAIWTDNMQVVQSNPDGRVFDNLAWGASWDVDPRDVVAPTLLVYGTTDAHCPQERDGRWYADAIAGSELLIVASAGHFDVIDGHWPQVLAGLLQTWGPPRRRAAGLR